MSEPNAVDERERLADFCVRLRATIELLLRRALPPALALCKPLWTLAERRAVLAWLRPIERLLRALVFLEVAALPPGPDLPERGEASEPRRGARDRDAPQPAPGFRIGLGVESGGSGGGAHAAAVPGELVSAWPVVERIAPRLEAIGDPSPYVRRIARRVGRKPAPGPDGPPRLGLSDLARAFLEAELAQLAPVPPPAAVDTS
jgi:hypothetical protein